MIKLFVHSLLSFFVRPMTVTDHIAILVCDVPIEPHNKTFGDFGDQCKELLVRGESSYPAVKYQICYIDEQRQQLQAVLDLLTTAINAKIVKGVVVTGSRSDSFDTLWWIQMLDDFIVKTLFPAKIPTVGFCFGHQILAKNLNVKVNRGTTWELGLQKISLKDDIAQKFPFDIVNSDSINLIEFHQDIVYNVPENVSLIGSSQVCSIQGLLSMSDLKLLTFQGHPEFSSPFSLELLLGMLEDGKITEAEYEKATSSIKSNQNNGNEIAKVVCNFIRGQSN
jgi:GMP synthase (glutamine-hydrolysing)